ncbi:hypothetical protein AK812_SmicGene6973 [Symbiodinium microadriaticum]|uniref:Uncharacterized protein n=1 Tax=Symbiodinium microadriaticum TaxID=2951 RepID=A0A1Q9EPQ6_SYMMI|nr:hypothetical protein AK812_SmicGene6973 [Symbiodinium microadriaticum]
MRKAVLRWYHRGRPLESNAVTRHVSAATRSAALGTSEGGVHSTGRRICELLQYVAAERTFAGHNGAKRIGPKDFVQLKHGSVAEGLCGRQLQQSGGIGELGSDGEEPGLHYLQRLLYQRWSTCVVASELQRKRSAQVRAEFAEEIVVRIAAMTLDGQCTAAEAERLVRGNVEASFKQTVDPYRLVPVTDHISGLADQDVYRQLEEANLRYERTRESIPRPAQAGLSQSLLEKYRHQYRRYREYHCHHYKHYDDGDDAAFTPAERFQGARPNCVFKLGDRGLGYYSEAWRMTRRKLRDRSYRA